MKARSIYFMRIFNNTGKCVMASWHGDVINAIECGEYWSKSLGYSYKLTFKKP